MQNNLIASKQKIKLLKQLKHKRFTTVSVHRQMRNERLSLSGCYWYAQTNRSIVPIGNENDSIRKRLSYVSEGA